MTTIREEVEAQHAAREQGMYALCQRLAGDLSTPSIRAAIRQHECSGITTEQLFDTILDARIAEAVADATEAAWRKAVIHSNYPIETDWERGYNAGRLDAGKAIRGEPSHTRDPAALRPEQSATETEGKS